MNASVGPERINLLISLGAKNQVIDFFPLYLVNIIGLLTLRGSKIRRQTPHFLSLYLPLYALF